MKRTKYFLNTLLVIIILLSLTGCGNTSITNNDSIEIYQLLIHYVYLEDNSFGKPVDIKYLYILKDTDDIVGDSQTTEQPSQRITDEVMDGISTKLSDLPLEIIWVNSRNEVLNPSVSLTVKDGAIVTLGNISMKITQKPMSQ